MELRPGLALQARQTITITPQVIQSIKMLKYGQEELHAFLKEQEERNPLIEVKSGPGETTPARTAHDRTPAQAGPGGGERWGIRGMSRSAGDDLRRIEETFASAVSLREHLLGQVDLAPLGPVDRLIAIDIVESIEPDGYLRRDLDEIADFLGVDEARVAAVLSEVQRFEPTGVGARMLAECLALQLAERGRMTAAYTALLDNLEMLASYEIDRLARVCGVDREELMAMVRTLRELDPKPGRQFSSDPVLPALPDVNVDVSEGSVRVELNSALLPRVLVDREYYARMRAGASGIDDVRFVTDCMKNAGWLTRNLDQRANTILKVATEIVKRQKDFFRHGVDHLRPLCQGDVAEALGIHRSTVCRAAAGKYMMTNRGMFELRFFFSNAIESDGGDQEFSAESIRSRIRQMIEAETVTTVLSDDAIMQALRGDGVQIARRTVAKYREMMHVPSSSVRKRQLQAALIEERAHAA